MTLTHKHLPVLLQARRMIDEGAQDYICFALEKVAIDHEDLDEPAFEVRRAIEAGLDHRSLLSHWLLDQLFGSEWRADDLPEPYHFAWVLEGGVMRLARLAWLDRLIANITEG